MSISNKFGSSSCLIVAIALVLLQPSSALNHKTANEVCNLLMDGIRIFSGSSCDQYYTCLSGLATLVACESGYYFSRDTQSCELASMVTCTTDSSPCAGIPNGKFVSVPNSCTNFYYCYNGVAQMGTCPEGLNFDPAGQSCNYKTAYMCSSDSTSDGAENINFCSVIPPGQYFGNSLGCNGWQECRSNGLVTGVCPSPYFYNVETGSCDYQDHVSCRQTNGVPTTISTAGSLAGTTCSDAGLKVSDNQTCIGFYTCTNSALVYNTCVGGLYFNPSTGGCVNRLDAINNCNRCEGTSLQFVNVYQDNCVGYASCSSGRVVSKGTCASGYFNENLQACVEGGTEPLFPVCNVAMDSSSNSTSTTAASASNSTSTTAASASNSTESSSSNGTDTTTVSTTLSGTNTTLSTTVSASNVTATSASTIAAGDTTTTVAAGNTTTTVVAGNTTTTVAAGNTTTTVAADNTTTTVATTTTTLA